MCMVGPDHGVYIRRTYRSLQSSIYRDHRCHLLIQGTPTEPGTLRKGVSLIIFIMNPLT